MAISNVVSFRGYPQGGSAAGRNAPIIDPEQEDKGPRWTAQICHEGIKHHLGVFDDEASAHAAYCEAARRLKGEFARLD